ncbi:MAG: VOC family protein [Planctomycetota bacterium]
MRLAHTMIRVKDLDETLAFYTEFLGLKKVREGKIGDEAVLVFLTDESERYHLELTYNTDGRDYELGDQFGHLAFHVDELEPIVKEVERRGWWYRRSKPGRTPYLRQGPQRLRHRDPGGEAIASRAARDGEGQGTRLSDVSADLQGLSSARGLVWGHARVPQPNAEQLGVGPSRGH